MSCLLESVGQILDWTELTSDTINELKAILLLLVMSALKYTVIIHCNFFLNVCYAHQKCRFELWNIIYTHKEMQKHNSVGITALFLHTLS